MRPPAVFVLLAVVAFAGALVWRAADGGTDRTTVSFSTFADRLEAGEVASAEVGNRTQSITGAFSDGTAYRTTFPADYGDELTAALRAAGVEVEATSQRPSVWSDLLFSLVPTVLIIGVLVWLVMGLGGSGAAGASRFGRSKAKRYEPDAGPRVTFADVAGLDEAIEELQEIKEFLKAPQRFTALGARIPKGVLLYGPPGTGKTLLAKAVAGEAGVPFFSISGSDFVEMFVGVGASRVRDLFEQARKAAPAIVFVDEIDAVGRQRGTGMGGVHDEREQTLNQLLVELDGFDARSGVILVAGTNRPDVLDPALLRPGRFDRHIPVQAPDLAGRRAILAVHAKDKPLAPEVRLDVLARRTPGFTGADLANVLNEAALLTARRHRTVIGTDELEAAIDRVVAGPERRGAVLSAADRERVAVHETGHALVGHLLAGTDPVHKVSIVARGQALGWTLALPDAEAGRDRHLHTRAELEDRLAMLLAGRVAEEWRFGDVTTGAADDIDRATELAGSMVRSWGMSPTIGPVKVAGRDGDPGGGHGATVSAASLERIDDEVRRLVETAAVRAREVLEAHASAFERIVAALLEHETLDADAFARLV